MSKLMRQLTVRLSEEGSNILDSVMQKLTEADGKTCTIQEAFHEVLRFYNNGSGNVSKQSEDTDSANSIDSIQESKQENVSNDTGHTDSIDSKKAGSYDFSFDD